MRNDKLQRLVETARLYYEQDKTQSEIAKQLGVSRPLISRMLAEAKALGVVEIRIHAPGEGDSLMLGRAKAALGLLGGALVSDEGDDRALNRAIASAAIDFVGTLGGERLGIGWGHIIGVLVSLLDERDPARGAQRHICPLVGNSGISIRNYHSNENVRIYAQQTEAEPHYLYTPAFCATAQELDLMRQTEHYLAVAREWDGLDVALVNIGNYPSTPDFGSQARYGDKLTREHAVGRIIAYYYRADGGIISSDTDYAVQIPLTQLAKCRRVVGLCSANVSAQALAGALQTGLITDLVARESVVRQALELLQF